MQSIAVLQSVCRRWRRCVQFADAQYACCSQAACLGNADATPAAQIRFLSGITDGQQRPPFQTHPIVDNNFKMTLSLIQQQQACQFSSIRQDPQSQPKPPELPPDLPVSWLNNVLPAKVLPYAYLMRLDKPIGTWLLAWPGFWSIALAAPAGSLPDLKLLALFGTGAVLLRGAGCTVNDLWDRDLDNQVERTKSRPLASGALSVRQGLGLLGGQLLLGLGVLLQLNDFSKVVGAASLALVFTYPLMKRITFWPQAFLGLTFNWGVLLGYAAVHGSLDLSLVLPLYAHGICWTLVYDTIYAHQDKTDDIVVGIKSTALLFGDQTKAYLTGFAATSIASLQLTGYMAGAGAPYYAAVAAAACHYAWQLSTVDLDSRQGCLAKFVSNKWFGGIVFSGIVLDRLVQTPVLT